MRGLILCLICLLPQVIFGEATPERIRFVLKNQIVVATVKNAYQTNLGLVILLDDPTNTLLSLKGNIRLTREGELFFNPSNGLVLLNPYRGSGEAVPIYDASAKYDHIQQMIDGKEETWGKRIGALVRPNPAVIAEINEIEDEENKKKMIILKEGGQIVATHLVDNEALTRFKVGDLVYEVVTVHPNWEQPEDGKTTYRYFAPDRGYFSPLFTLEN